MSVLMKIMAKAVEDKPKFGSPCNNCGWCCLTEVCVVGQELGGGTIAPCKLLIAKDGKHFYDSAGTILNCSTTILPTLSHPFTIRKF